MDDAPSPLWWWEQLVDPLCGDESRWSSSKTGPVQSPDLIGDALVAKLLHCARSVQNGRPIAGWSKTLFERLGDYEDEPRLLVKLADTGRVVQLLERGIDTTLHILDIYTANTRDEWGEQLRLERDNRMAVYEELLARKDLIGLEMGDEVQQVEVLTLMKYGMEKFGEFLTPRELDVISAICDAIVSKSTLVVGVLPTWFTASRPDNARQTNVKGEEACLRQVSLWASLHHPNIRKFYGACHVGNPSVLHEEDQQGPATWSFFRECAFGLEYVHRRGFAHNKLTASALCYRKDEKRGILSGAELRKLRDDHTGMNDVNSDFDLHPQISEDMEAFGRAIFVMLAQHRGQSNTEPDQQLSASKPEFLSGGEWDLLKALQTSEGFGISDFFERMEELDKVERKESRSEIYGYTLAEEDRNDQPIEDITSYILPTAGRTISDLLQSADPLCEAVSERAGMNRSVYNRLIDLYDQFVQCSSALPLELVETYALIVWDFFMKLEEQSDTLCSAPSLCNSRTIANRNHSLQHDIDSLLAKGSGLLKSSDIHAWKFRTSCPTIDDELEFEENDEDDTFLQTSGTFIPGDTVSSRPTWFIPVEEVSRKDPIASGAFGAVYEASWLGTSVVLKQVFEANKGHRKQFYREANLWFHLSHKNLIQLYGANHEERPFFVCEKAVGKTLPEFLKRERGSRLWKCIQQAALGLENLHNQGIIHGDLKGNNLLVWMAHVTDFESANTKVADFGMSVRANGMAPLVNPSDLGAVQWRAPEILSGGPPSFASDIYSFGMCIIEAATGAYPAQWRATQERWAPPRPQELSEGQWNLIMRMCRFDALERIDASAVVNILHNGAFDGRYRKDTSRSDDSPEGDAGGKGIDKPDTHEKEIVEPVLAPKPLPRSGNRWHRRNCPTDVIETPDRLGDYLVALRNDFVAKHPVCRRGLNLSGQLSTYESETRVLLKLASTGRVVSILLRFGGVIEGYMKVMDIKATEEVLAWKDQLEVERQQRVELFNKILEDEQRWVGVMGDETQKMVLLTLLRHDVATYSEILTPEELDVMSDVYDRVVEHSGIVLVGDPPSWFLSPSDLLCENGIYYLDGVRVSKCLTGEVLSTVTGHESWEDQEEACLRQATVWAELNHPHVARMLGACHIGQEPFVMHEPSEPLVSNRASAQSWEPVFGWALGLQYLHERELGYKNFDDSRLLVRHSQTHGILTGLGLIPVTRNTSASLKRGVSNMFSMKDLEQSLQPPENEDTSPSWSVPNDIFAFGLAIYNTRQWVSMYSDEKVLVLPPECPSFLDEQEWDVVQRMCARIPHHRVSMWYVVQQLLAFVQSSEPKDKTKLVDLSVTPEDDVNEEITERTPEKIDDFIVPKMCVKVAVAMVRFERTCAEWDESGAMLKNVFNRLSSLHSQLQARDIIKDATKIMEAFVKVVDLFYTELTRHNIGKDQSKSSEVAPFCASRAAAQNIAVFHHEIDRLLTLAQLRVTTASAQAPPSHVRLAGIREDTTDSISSDPSTPETHDWRIEWRKMRRQQLRAFQSCLKKEEELKEQLRDPNTRLEAQMLLQFELQKRRSSYPNSVLDAMVQALKVLETMGDGAEPLPSWFIPPYEVVLGKRIAEGGFGEVYYGKWFDTDVVVKILKSQPAAPTAAKTEPSPPTSSSGLNEDNTMELSRSEADHWFMLNHQNVVHLYGACHVGTPFFVCEPAKPTSLYSHVKELACAKPGYNFEENGGDRSDIMRCLFLVGLGLKYLHEQRIVHCDLKGNNFMVGTDGKTIKLGDFGMSVLKGSGNGRHAAHENAGAVPWKAPEYLQGEPATVMSDVYSFGMCILEILSGDFPWGHMPDAAVKFHVTRRKALPSRPKNLSDFQWSLIQHMCCFNPSDRISLDAVVDMLHTFRFEK